MPPQQTNIISEPLAAARPDAPNAARALSETAGATAASTRSVLGLLKRVWCAFQERRQRESLRTGLAGLRDRELMDIGLTREEIDYITPQRAIDRLRDRAYLSSRGVM